MKKVLGLDLGVSSIGWAFIEQNRDNEVGRIRDLGVRIVPLNADEANEFSTGNAISTNKGRTMKRGARRTNQRFKLRRKRLLNIMFELGWIPGNFQWQTNDSLEIYGLRAKAVAERLDKQDLAKVFLALNGKRGYLSNRKGQNEEEEGTDYLENIRERDRELITRGITIGQKHLELLLENRWSTLLKRTYSRKSYRAEFDQIWNTQRIFYPELTDKLYREIADKTIFYQRPLRSQKGLISKCTLEPLKRVAPKSSPVFQEFKIWQQIHNLRINDEAGTLITIEQPVKKILFEQLNAKGKMTSAQLKKFLGYSTKDPLNANFETLEGNYTRSALLKVFEDTNYDTFDLLDIDYTLKDNAFDKQGFMQLWHLLYSATDQDRLVQKLILNFGFNELQAKAVATVRLVKDYGSLSVRAMRKILPHMKEGLTYDEAALKAGYRHSLHETLEERDNRKLKERLDTIQKGKLRNPVVEKILNQLVHVINAIIDDPTLGRPDEIRIELARELKMNAKKRKQVTTQMQADARKNEAVVKKLTEEFGLKQISKKDIVKYKLWEESGGISLYTGKPISASRLFTTDDYDVDHIIPQSRLFDDSFANKVLCESAINREKGNKTAWEYIQSKGESESRRFLQDIEQNKTMKLSKKLKLRMNLEEIPEDFISRQLKESQYIVKHALSLVKQVCREVSSTSGTVTSFLRNEWGLAHIMQDLNQEKYEALGRVYYKELQGGKRIAQIEEWSKRDDHRHHAVDALVVACTSQGIIQKLNTLNQRFDSIHQGDHGKTKFPVPWAHFRSEAREALSRVLISFKAKNKVATWNNNRTKAKGKHNYNMQRTLTPRGQLHLETVYGKMRWYEPNLTPLNKTFTRTDLIVDPEIRTLVAARWLANNNDPHRASQSLKRDPILYKGKPITEVRCFSEQFTIRKPVDPNLNLNKVVDPKIRSLLLERLMTFNDDKKKAFTDLDKKPIWLNRDKGIAVKSVKVIDNGDLIPLRYNRNEAMDYAYTKSNHHAAIFKGPDGSRTLEMVSFFEAVERKRQGIPVFANQNAEGWPLDFTLQINDYFLFDINPEELDILDIANRNLLSNQLFRVQTLSTTASGGPDFRFRHQLETTLKNDEAFSYRRIQSFTKLNGFKVHVDRLGRITRIGQ